MQIKKCKKTNQLKNSILHRNPPILNRFGMFSDLSAMSPSPSVHDHLRSVMSMHFWRFYHFLSLFCIFWVNWTIFRSSTVRGGRYYRKKLSIADKLAFFKLSANYRYWKKYIWELSKNYRYRKMCLQFHPINSIESTVPKTRKRVFHILDEYEIVFENSAQSCAAILAEHLGL